MRRTGSLIRQVLPGRTVLSEQTQTLKMAAADYARVGLGERYRDGHLPNVLHLNENFLCVDKGYDIKINGNDPSEMTLEHQLRKMYPELIDPTVEHSFRYVHRLDYATSGILCLALNKNAARVLAKEFRLKRVTKIYLALVRGHLEDDIVFVDVPTGDLVDTVWPGRRCIQCHPSCSDPRLTQTLVVPLETGSFDGEPATKVMLKPITGKQHQLRVHCDYIGHRIVGDFTYSLRQDTKPERMMLHSHRLFVNTKLETLDLTTDDPFTSSVLPEWTPVNVCRTYRDAEHIAVSFIPYETENVKTLVLECENT